jgi:formylglycine-generating enzyme required for sulfatase activity
VRGGSWLSNQWYGRCAFRLRYHPEYFDLILSFRLVLSLADSGS